MRANDHLWRQLFAAGGFCTLLLAGAALITAATADLKASPLFPWRCRHAGNTPMDASDACQPVEEWEGTWYWLRSPEQERRVVMGLYNRYCIRCHAVDGRGVWDIPDVPNFTDARWQASRPDGQRVRIILEGRGAVMPPFRGTLTLEEAWAMARYLRTFVPGTEAARPDISQPAQATNDTAGSLPAPRQASP